MVVVLRKLMQPHPPAAHTARWARNLAETLAEQQRCSNNCMPALCCTGSPAKALKCLFGGFLCMHELQILHLAAGCKVRVLPWRQQQQQQSGTPSRLPTLSHPC